MKILFISHESELNGASLSLLGLIEELQKENDIYVLTCYKNSNFVKVLDDKRVHVIYYPYFRWMISNNCSKAKWLLKKEVFKLLGIINYISAIKLSKYVKEKKIDIIHSNSTVVNIGGILSKMTGIKHIWHIREFGKEDFGMEFVYNEVKSLEFIGENSESVICISKAIKNKYSRLIRENKCILIYNGINEKYLNKKKITSHKNFNMLIAGRLEKAKGQEEAILAMRELIKNGIYNLKLYIAGTGELESELKNMVNKFELENYVFFCGRIENMKEIRNRMDIELVCSRNEAFGRVTIEAMMSSNPVIGANTGGTKELVIDGFNGYLYNQGDSFHLAQVIKKIISDNSKFNELSNNAYIYSKKYFTSKINSTKIKQLYEKTIGN